MHIQKSEKKKNYNKKRHDRDNKGEAMAQLTTISSSRSYVPVMYHGVFNRANRANRANVANRANRNRATFWIQHGKHCCSGIERAHQSWRSINDGWLMGIGLRVMDK